jgi:hypothetical protein
VVFLMDWSLRDVHKQEKDQWSENADVTRKEVVMNFGMCFPWREKESRSCVVRE